MKLDVGKQLPWLTTTPNALTMAAVADGPPSLYILPTDSSYILLKTSAPVGV